MDIARVAASGQLRITETQLGAVGENLVANGLLMASAGRLSPFRPIADDGGIDILLYDKISGQALPLQIKTRTVTLRRSPKIVHFQVRRATFVPHHHGHILYVYFDRESLGVHRSWLVPMRTFVDVSAARSKHYVIRPSVDPTSADRYTDYRCAELSEVAERLVAYFDSLASHR